MVGSRELDGWL